MTKQQRKRGNSAMPIKAEFRKTDLTSSDWKKIKLYQREEKRSIEYEQAKAFIGEAIKESNIHFLERTFREIEPMDFYQSIFKDYLDEPYEFNKGEYTALVLEKTKQEITYKSGKKGKLVNRYVITNGLNELDSLIATSKNFCFMSPISYCGNKRNANNARFYFAMVIEVDDLIIRDGVPAGLRDLVYQALTDQIPEPTYIVHSGNGVHLYYVFSSPYPMYDFNKKLLDRVRRQLVYKIWNNYITNAYHRSQAKGSNWPLVQVESLNQAFRVVGTRTKKGLEEDTDDLTRAFIFGNGDTVDFEYLASFTDVKNADKIKLKPTYTKEQLKELFPDWYKNHFTKSGRRKSVPKVKSWKCNSALYDWYLKQIPEKATEGHRYYSLLVLASYALKCRIPKKQFEADCWGLKEELEKKTTNDFNHFTDDDIKSAIQCYKQKNLTVLTIDRINSLTGFGIEKNKRSEKGQTMTRQAALAKGRAMQEINLKYNGKNWRDGNGRKTKQSEVLEWRANNPDGTQYRCQKETGIDKKTIRKWWNTKILEEHLDYGI